MLIDWKLSEQIKLDGISKKTITPTDAERQTFTASEILKRLCNQPGVILADEVGMGKTYVAMAVIASILESSRSKNIGPILIMVPPSLLRKWQRDWQQFKAQCTRRGAFSWVRDAAIAKPIELFKLLEEEKDARQDLIFLPQTCFLRSLDNPLVKLAMIRLARGHRRLREEQKRRLARWVPILIRMSSQLEEKMVENLLQRDVSDWPNYLNSNGAFPEIVKASNAIPKGIFRHPEDIDWSELITLLGDLPGKRPEYVSSELKKEWRSKFNEAFQSIYKQMLSILKWKSPLLILDEAHHIKNDATNIAKLFRPESQEAVATLKNKFDRMLFLTATPFQLGHAELIRVLKSFSAIRWNTPNAPEGTEDEFVTKIDSLEKSLDQNRIAARTFDRLWGKVKRSVVGITEYDSLAEAEVKTLHWWHKTVEKPKENWQHQLIEAYDRLRKSKEDAQNLLRPWVIRHNRPQNFITSNGKIPRRNFWVGDAICNQQNQVNAGRGISIERESIMPFLITARVQGQLEVYTKTRAYFADGLASSYEAFHHTRENKYDRPDDPVEDNSTRVDKSWQVPIDWYKNQIVRLIPSRNDTYENRQKHPKIAATVNHALQLWKQGEKVLIFCYYLQTVRAIREHIEEKVKEEILKIAGQKLELDIHHSREDIQDWLSRIEKRLAKRESPLRRAAEQLFEQEFFCLEHKFLLPKNIKQRVLRLLLSYLRTPAFIVRYMPLEDKLVRRALARGQNSREVIQRGIDALKHAILNERDASGQTFRGKIHEFLNFCNELAERAEYHFDGDYDESGESKNPLLQYLAAAGGHTIRDLVRSVDGNSDLETRERLLQSFNSPLFPEIVIASSVMTEGVDMHRFCRHIIHHDFDWNPSVIEQRIGRIDRVRCKAEVTKKSIEVAEPFIAGSADEKMYRVCKDRERWFAVVMGQNFNFDEATSEKIAERIPLPKFLSKNLVFSLSCYSGNDE